MFLIRIKLKFKTFNFNFYDYLIFLPATTWLRKLTASKFTNAFVVNCK
jgi:hypothetical protein